MVPEGTLGKWSLWARHPKRLGGIAELFATTEAAAARAADLRQASGAALSTVPREAAGRATCWGCLQLPLATRTGADHMSNRKVAKLVGASKVITAAAHD
jgi:hypothetical protein